MHYFISACHSCRDLTSPTPRRLICAMPSVLYAKDISTTWEYNDYISQYTVTGLQASIFNGCKIKMLSLPRLLQNVVGGFTGAEIGGFTIDSANSYFSVTNNVYALYDKSGTTLYAYPSNQSLYSAAYSGVMLKSGVTRIEDQAFANCKLYKINIPSSVTYMGDRVFIGSSVGTIVFDGNSPSFRFLPEQSNDHGTFEGASKLDMITITGTNGNYNTYNGALYNKDKTKLLLCPQGGCPFGKLPLHSILEPLRDTSKPFLLHPDALVGAAAEKRLLQCTKPCILPGKSRLIGDAQSIPCDAYFLMQDMEIGCSKLCSRRGRWRTPVSHRISDRHVCLMSDSRNDRHRAIVDRIGDIFRIKSAQVLCRSAATSENEHITALCPGKLNGTGDGIRCLFTLHQNRKDLDLDDRASSAQNLEDVLQGSTRCVAGSTRGSGPRLRDVESFGSRRLR